MNAENSAVIDLSWIGGENRTNAQFDDMINNLRLLGNTGYERSMRRGIASKMLAPNSSSLQDLYLLERLFEFETLLIDESALNSCGMTIPSELNDYLKPVTPSREVYILTATELHERMSEIPKRERMLLGDFDYLPKTRYFDKLWKDTNEFPSAIAESNNSNDWIRAVFYLAFANQLGSNLLLSGQKSQYLSTISNICTDSQHEVVRRIFDAAFTEELKEHYPDEESMWSIYANQTPPIIEYVISKSVESDTSALDILDSLRQSREAVEYRDLLSQLRNYSQGTRSDRVEAMKISKSLSKVAKVWAGTLDMGNYIDYVPRTLKLKKLPLIGNILELAELDEVKLKDYLLSSPPGYLVFCASWYGKDFKFGESEGLLAK